MIPFFEQPSVRIGPLEVHAFGLIVATSMLFGLELGRRRFRKLALDQNVGERLAWSAIIGGFLGAHLFASLLYFPEEVADNPLVLLKFWEDLSSFGGMLGGLLAIWLYLRRHQGALSRSARWLYADVVAYVFPFALAVGRIACSVAHDHPGTITTFPLAISLDTEAGRGYILAVYEAAGRVGELPAPSALAQLGFHDLGWYEFLYLALVVCPLTWLVGRSPRRPGTFLALFIVLYMPVRFALDLLRVGDARYASLTPAQWSALLLLAALPVLWRYQHKQPGIRAEAME